MDLKYQNDVCSAMSHASSFPLQELATAFVPTCRRDSIRARASAKENSDKDFLAMSNKLDGGTGRRANARASKVMFAVQSSQCTGKIWTRTGTRGLMDEGGQLSC